MIRGEESGGEATENKKKNKKNKKNDPSQNQKRTGHSSQN